jgi:hypothetical protein
MARNGFGVLGIETWSLMEAAAKENYGRER